METTRLAIYDMDKTVTRYATYNRFLLHLATRQSQWRLFLIPFLPVGLAAYALKYWNRDQLKEFSQGLLLGRQIDKAKSQPHIDSHAAHVVKNNILPQALAQIKADKSAGYRLVLATASYRLYVEPIAAALGFDDVIATDLSEQDGKVQAQIQNGNCYGEVKLDKIKQWMKAQHLDRATCHIRGYSDHVSDAPLLEFADEAFATNPHQPLTELAQMKNWPILHWR